MIGYKTDPHPQSHQLLILYQGREAHGLVEYPKKLSIYISIFEGNPAPKKIVF
jgi:hypothetical protein